MLEIAVGAEDFLGTKRFNAQYIVATKQFFDWNLECTLGWGKGRIKGFFGGAVWTPFREQKLPFLKDLSFLLDTMRSITKNTLMSIHREERSNRG